MSHIFCQHLETCGVMQQLSCPISQQRNDISKHKHGHVVVTGLTMLFHANVPIHD